MKGDIYYLKDSDGRTVAKFEQEEEYMDGKVYCCVGWDIDYNPCEWEFFASVCCKADSCSHWFFYGEDYYYDKDNEHDFGKDSYYHICGGGCFTEFTRLMCFVWTIAPDIIHEELPQYDRRTREYYSEHGSGELCRMMLSGYTIEKGEEK